MTTGVRVLPTLLAGFPGPTLPEWLHRRLGGGLGGVCLFARNIVSPDQLVTLTAAILEANPQAIIALDEEGGDVTRLFADVGSPYPGNALLGRLDDPALTAAVAIEVGWALRRAGATMTFAPSVDVNSNPDNPVIGVRSFGGDSALVARHAAAWIAGVQAAGIAATAKHFPGHGDTAQDSHVSLPAVNQSLEELRREALVPFVAAIEAGTKAIMTSHIVLPRIDPANPATMSRRVLIGVLRDELRYDGLIVTDALDMAGADTAGGMPETAIRALAAGSDLLCLGNNSTDDQITAIERAVDSAITDQSLGRSRLDDATKRVLALADGLIAERASIPIGVGEAADPLTDEMILGSFDLGRDVRAWRARAAGRFTVVRIEDEPNAAVGSLPWGPDFSRRGELIVGQHQVAPPAAPADRSVLVIGRDLHRHAFAREAVDRLRTSHDVLVADLGWPSADRVYAQIATFGASRRVGEVLRAWLENP